MRDMACVIASLAHQSSILARGGGGGGEIL